LDLPVCSGLLLDLKVGRRGVGKSRKELHPVSEMDTEKVRGRAKEDYRNQRRKLPDEDSRQARWSPWTSRADCADMLIPTMQGKRSAGTLRVKAARITSQKIGRLEARRARGYTHRKVGMSSWEDRLAAILPLTRTIRSDA
jgi:hypothetical protein